MKKLFLLFVLFISSIVAASFFFATTSGLIWFSILASAVFVLSIDHQNHLLVFFIFAAMLFSGFVTIMIVVTVLAESIKFFQVVSISDFLFGTKWYPYPHVSEGVIVQGTFGVLPLVTGTLMVIIVSLLVALPASLCMAIYISEYMSSKSRNFIKPILEALAAIPTVLYGYFAIVTLAPLVRKLEYITGLPVSSENAIVAGVAIGLMMIPFITSSFEDIIYFTPKGLRYASIALGATNAETVFRVLLPVSMPGIYSICLLAVSRVIGETMIVLMAVGASAHLTFSPFKPVTTVTVQIANMLLGDNSFDSIQSLAAYALSLFLFIITWMLNMFAITITKKAK